MTRLEAIKDLLTGQARSPNAKGIVIENLAVDRLFALLDAAIAAEEQAAEAISKIRICTQSRLCPLCLSAANDAYTALTAEAKVPDGKT